MPNDPKGSPKRGWRVGGGSDDAAPGWRKKTAAATTTPARRKLSRKTVFGVALALFLGTVGLFIWVATKFRPPSPSYLVLVGADYADNLAVPHNLDGWQGLKALSTFAGGGKWSFLWSERPLFGGPGTPFAFDMKSREQWAAGLKDQKEETLLVWFAAHGGVDNEGAYLIPDDYDPYASDEKSGRAGVLRLGDLLDRLPRDKKKVLLFDATVLTAHWPLGMLHNDFAQRLRQELDEREKAGQVANLIVLSACDVGERSWASDVWRRTVFGHYVLQGLAGDADAGRDGSVSAQELIDYVREKVAIWVRVNRDEVQRPVAWVSKDARPESVQLAVVSERRPEPPPEADADALLTELRAAWKTHDELGSLVPHPAIYGPQHWQRYRDTLLRYEEVRRAGDPTSKSAKLKGDLANLEKVLRAGAACDLPPPQTALASALPMPAALGRSAPWSDDDLRGQLAALRAAKTPDERQEQWNKLGAWAGLPKDPARQPLLRARVSAVLLHELAGPKAAPNVTPEERANVRDLLELIWPGANLRPAEVHYLLMLEHLTKPAPDPKLVGEALQVRLLAEEAALAAGPRHTHPFAEKVHPWISEGVARADRERRLGEDWLFGEEQAHWDKAAEHFDAARQLYEQARDDGRLVREALDAQARALSDLPYYAAWLARRRLSPDSVARQEEDAQLQQLVNRLERLGERTHQLTALLRQPDPARIGEAKAAPDPNQPTLASLGAEVAKGRADLKQAYDQIVRVTDAADQHRYWHDFDAALGTPLLGAEPRERLLRGRQRIARAYHIRPEGPDEAGWYENRKKLVEGDTKAAAGRQGRLAATVLGKAWAEEGGKLLKQPPERATRLDGDQIGSLFRLLPREAQRRANQVVDKRWLDSADSKGFRGTVTRDLAGAAALCRHLDGAAAAQLPGDPVQDYRRWELHDLLLEQAGRAWADQWWWYKPTDSEGRPYYAVATDALVTAANDLAEHGVKDKGFRKPRLQRVADARTKLQETKLEAVPDGPATLALTTENTFPVAWRITTGNGIPREAVPMVRVLPSRGVEPAKTGESLETRRPLVDWGTREVRAELRAPELVKAARDPYHHPEQPARSASAQLKLFYRGRPVEPTTRLDLYLGADTVIFRHPPPPNARLAVRADEDIPRGAVAIVLDLSGSMESPVRGNAGPTKIEAAREALDKLLRRLGPGTLLGVWVFGDKTGQDNVTESAAHTRVDVLRPLGPWEPSQRGPLLDAVRQRKPMNWTHLVQGMLDAKAGLLADKRCQGLYKTILVLTDGRDTMWPNPNVGEEARVREIPRAVAKAFSREALGDEKLVVNMVLFGGDTTALFPFGTTKKTEREIARLQFKDALESLPERGIWEEATDGDKLAALLYEGLRPRLYLYQNDQPVEGMPREGYKVTYTNELGWIWSNPFRPLREHFYRADVQSGRQKVGFDPGDNLLMNLRRRDGQVRLERRLSVEEYARRAPVHQQATQDGRATEWQLAVHQNRHERFPSKTSTGNGLQVLAMIESTQVAPRREAAGDAIVDQPKPWFQWFELASDQTVPTGLRWRNDFRFPAPAWRLHVADWPTKGGELAPPTLEAFWTAGGMTDGYVVKAHAPGRDPLTEFRDVKSVDGIEVTIEGIDDEEREVEVAPGRTEKHHCMVVRLRHTPGKPVLVRLTDINKRNIDGEEHYFYQKPGKVTAVFWPVRSLREAAFTLQLISVDAFKRQAMSVKQALPTPRNDDDGPQPVPSGP